MVIYNGKTIIKKCYGLANIETNIPVRTNTNFRLASVTKQFTAMSIMMLREKNQLSYDQTLTDIFPDFPSYGHNITIRNILQHTSGLLDYESLIPDTATTQVLDADVLDMMKKADSTYFEPGTAYRYSNTGYALLAMIIEHISGLSYAKFLDQNIFKPLNMSGTVAFEKGKSKVYHRAYGYTIENDSIKFSDQSITSAVLGDGGIYSSLEDLYHWDQDLYKENLVKKSTLQEAFTPLVLPDGSKEQYGFGWRIDTYKAERRIHHNGSSRGFRSVIQRFPEKQLTVVVLANRSEPNLFPVAEKISDLYF